MPAVLLIFPIPAYAKPILNVINDIIKRAKTSQNSEICFYDGIHSSGEVIDEIQKKSLKSNKVWDLGSQIKDFAYENFDRVAFKGSTSQSKMNSVFIMEISSEFLNYQEQVSAAVVRRLQNGEKAGQRKEILITVRRKRESIKLIPFN